MRAMRQELRSHSTILWSVLDRAAHLTPPPDKVLRKAGAPRSWRNIWAKGGSLVSFQLFGVIPNLAKILRQDSASIRSVHPVSYTHLTLPTILLV